MEMREGIDRRHVVLGSAVGIAASSLTAPSPPAERSGSSRHASAPPSEVVCSRTPKPHRPVKGASRSSIASDGWTGNAQIKTVLALYPVVGPSAYAPHAPPQKARHPAFLPFLKYHRQRRCQRW